MIISARCRTNLDDYDCNMVTRFVAVPHIGDRVSVQKKGFGLTSLKVVGITHKERDGVPYIEVELNK